MSKLGLLAIGATLLFATPAGWSASPRNFSSTDMAKHVGKTVIPRSLLIQMLRGIAEQYGVSANLVQSVAEVESNLDVNEVSSKGARGVMQVTPKSFALVMDEGDDINNVNDNIVAGVRLLKSAIDRFGRNLPDILTDYNLGQPGKDRALKHGHLPEETVNYIDRVTKAFLDKQ